MMFSGTLQSGTNGTETVWRSKQLGPKRHTPAPKTPDRYGDRQLLSNFDRLCERTPRTFGETLIISFDQIRTNGHPLIPFVVSLSKHERSRINQRVLRLFHIFSPFYRPIPDNSTVVSLVNCGVNIIRTYREISRQSVAQQAWGISTERIVRGKNT